MSKAKRYEEGGEITEGQNANIDDDTRSRALAWVKKQNEKSESVTSTPVRKAAPKKAPAVTDTGIDAETVRASRTKAPAAAGKDVDLLDQIPGKRGSTNEVEGGDSASGSELGRNIHNALMAGAGRAGVQAGKSLAIRAADKLEKAKAAARVKDLRTNRDAWAAGPRGPLGKDANATYKKGGSVRGWGQARGARAAKIV